MAELPVISVYVKLEFWEIYRLNLVLYAILFRTFPYICVAIGALWFLLSTFLILHPSRAHDWNVMMQNAKPLSLSLWGLPPVVLLLPLLSTRRLSKDKQFASGATYQFSAEAIHIETAVAKTDLSWSGIHGVREYDKEFLVFTKPNMAFALPKRCFDSVQNVKSLRELFAAHTRTIKPLFFL